MTNKNETGAPETGAETPPDAPPDEASEAPEKGTGEAQLTPKQRKELEANLIPDPGLLERVFDQRTKTGADALSGEDPIPRATAEFIMDHTCCAPGIWPGDFKIKIRSLTSGEEMDAMRGVDDPMAIATTLAKASIFALNGTPIKSSDQKDFLWEAIGSGGRQVVQNMFAQTGFAPQRALGKAMASITIG